MSKMKKLLSLAVAGAMMLSTMVVSAGAVDVNEETDSEPQALSEYAGETMAVNVVRVSEKGVVAQKTVEVDIPEDATQTEQKSIVATAANAAAGYTMTRSAKAPFGTLLSRAKTATISPSGVTASNTILNNGISSVNYSTLTVYMYNIDRTISGINVSVWTNSISMSDQGGKVYIANTPVTNESTCTVIFYDGYTAPSGDQFWITAGDSVYAYGSTTGGTGKVTTELYGN